MSDIININLFAGPGTGKSTTAAGLFYNLKKKNFNIEYIQEFAKELTYSKDYTRLSDQLLLLGEQHHRLHRLRNQVEYVIHDSPFLMGLAYISNDPHLPKESYKKFILDVFNSYNNINIFLERNEKEYGYQEEGRIQSLKESQEKDKEIKNILKENNIPFFSIQVDKNIIENIENIVLKEKTKKQKNKKIFLINGIKRSGKDYTGSIIEESLKDRTYKLSFADPLKNIMARTLNITLEELDELKDTKSERGIIVELPTGPKKITMRQALQTMGTEGIRKEFGDNIFVETVNKKINNSNKDIIIMPDFRFTVEYTKLEKNNKNLDIKTILVENKRLENNDNHASENNLKDFNFDYVLDNTNHNPNLSDETQKILIKENLV